MKQARRVDNGKVVQGYYSVCIEPMDEPVLLHYVTDIENNSVIVDPATVEDVPVKPNRDGWIWTCPNCNFALALRHDGKVRTNKKHCPECGQRIDWSGENGE